MYLKQRIKGKVAVYSVAVKAGTILGEDNKTYLFSRKDWSLPMEPETNLLVIFDVQGNKAVSIAVDD